MSKKSLKLLAVSLALIVLLASSLTVLTGCSSREEGIWIGVFVPLSGGHSPYGQDMLRSYQLAVEEINATGGVRVDGELHKLFLYEADVADPGMSTAAASKITSFGVDFVVGGYASGAVTPILQVFFDEDLLFLISAANSTAITAAGFNQSFMINSPGTHALLTLIDLCNMLDVQSVALIHQGCAYTKDLADLCAEGLPQADISIATIEVMEPNAPDVSAIVTAIRNSGADMVYWCGYHADGSNVIRQLRRGGYEGFIAVGDGSASAELITASGSDGEGVFVTSPPFVEFAEGGAEFVANYKAMHNVDPDPYAALSYDTIYLLKAAIEKADSIETDAVRDALQNIEFQGLSGLIKFTPDREPAYSNFIILQIKDGQFELVKP
jgi:branched-chain amino acid transport system substrate-binding protein